MFCPGFTTCALVALLAGLTDEDAGAILARLASGEATVKELAAPFAIGGPAVSRHLTHGRFAFAPADPLLE